MSLQSKIPSLQVLKSSNKCSIFLIFQSEEEGKPVIGVYSNFDPAPDAQTLYKAMKGLGELTPVTCVNSMLCL